VGWQTTGLVADDGFANGGGRELEHKRDGRERNTKGDQERSELFHLRGWPMAGFFTEAVPLSTALPPRRWSACSQLQARPVSVSGNRQSTEKAHCPNAAECGKMRKCRPLARHSSSLMDIRTLWASRLRASVNALTDCCKCLCLS